MSEIIKLKKIATVIMGQSPKGDTYNDIGTGLPLLNGAADYKGRDFKPKQFTTAPVKIAQPGDILLGIRATIGNFSISDNTYCIGRGVAAIRPNNSKVDTYFLIHAIERNLSSMIQFSVGSTIKGIKKEDLTEMLIPLPPLKTQKKVATILDRADELRQNDRKILEKYDQLAQSVFFEMFGDPVKNAKKWGSETLKSVSNQITDGTHDTPERISNGKKFITGKHIRPFKIDYDNSDYVSEDDHNEIIKRCFPEFGDVLYTNIGVNLGTAAINTVDYVFSMKNVALIKYKREVLHGRFLESLLNTKIMKTEIIRMASLGGAQQFLSLLQIRDLRVLIPPLNLQIQFAEIIDKIEIQKEITQKSLQKCEDLFQSLLQRAFRGELV